MTDHDNLSVMSEMLSKIAHTDLQVSRTEANVESLKDRFSEHISQDKVDFARVHKHLDSLAKSMEKANQIPLMQQDVEYIKSSLDKMSGKFTSSMKEQRKEFSVLEDRIKVIEDWKLIFATKLTVYSTFALFIGTIISQLGCQLISKKLGL